MNYQIRKKNSSMFSSYLFHFKSFFYSQNYLQICRSRFRDFLCSSHLQISENDRCQKALRIPQLGSGLEYQRLYSSRQIFLLLAFHRQCSCLFHQETTWLQSPYFEFCGNQTGSLTVPSSLLGNLRLENKYIFQKLQSKLEIQRLDGSYPDLKTGETMV